MKKQLLALIFTLAANAVAAQPTIWEGKIGKYPIYFYLNCDPEKNTNAPDDCRNSRYFYTSSLQDIVIRSGGPVEKNKYVLNVSHDSYTGEPPISEKFLLVYKNNKFEGSWHNQSKKLAVYLERYKPETFPTNWHEISLFETRYSDDMFEYIRLPLLKFAQLKSQTIKSIKINWLKEKHSKLLFFRIHSGIPEEKILQINRVLKKIHNEYATSVLSCAHAMAYGTGMDSIKFEITYLTENLLAFNADLSYYCGGAYPNYSNPGYLLDLNTAQILTLEHILAFRKNVPVINKSGEGEWFSYRTGEFSRGIKELAYKSKGWALQPSANRPANRQSDESCDYNRPEIWSFLTWHYTDKGLSLFPSFPRVEIACSAEFIIPFNQLEKFKSPLFPYAFQSS